MLASVRSRHILVAVIGILILIGLPAVVDLITLLELSVYVVYAILALSLVFIWGYGGTLCFGQAAFFGLGADRSEEHTSELQSLMRISYAVFCLKKTINRQQLLTYLYD